MSALVVCLFPAYLAFTPPAPPPKPAPGEARRIDASVTEKRKALENLATGASSHESRPFSLTLREEEINRMLETDERVQRVMKRERIERAWVKIEESRILVTAVRSGTPSALSVSVAPALDAEHRLTLSIHGVRVGRLGLPAVGGIRRAAESAVRKLAESGLPQKTRFEDLEVGSGMIRLSGTTR